MKRDGIKRYVNMIKRGRERERETYTLILYKKIFFIKKKSLANKIFNSLKINLKLKTKFISFKFPK